MATSCVSASRVRSSALRSFSKPSVPSPGRHIPCVCAAHGRGTPCHPRSTSAAAIDARGCCASSYALLFLRANPRRIAPPRIYPRNLAGRKSCDASSARRSVGPRQRVDFWEGPWWGSRLVRPLPHPFREPEMPAGFAAEALLELLFGRSRRRAPWKVAREGTGDHPRPALHRGRSAGTASLRCGRGVNGEGGQSVPLQQEGVAARFLGRADQPPAAPRPLVEDPAQDLVRRVLIVGGEADVLAVVASRAQPVGCAFSCCPANVSPKVRMSLLRRSLRAPARPRSPS